MFVRINQRTINSGQPKDIWYVFQTDLPTMKDIHEALVRERRLFGVRFDTRPRGDRRREIVDEQETSIEASTVVSVMEMADDLYDDDGTPVFLLSGEAEGAA